MQRSIRFAAGITALAIALAAPSARAQADYPANPVSVVVGFPPGTATDTVARVLGERLAVRMGKPFVIDNRTGQGGSIGAAYVAKAAPDGYTLLATATAPLSINPHLYGKLPYDPVRDFAPIGLHSWLPYALVINPGLKINTYAELIERAKAQPGKLNYASIGNGSTGHLMMVGFMQRTGAKFAHVPYKGSAQAQTDVIGGQVDLMFDTLTTVMPHVRAGRLKALAVSTQARSQYAPEIPTLHEQGLTGFDAGAWLGWVAPAGTPRAIVERLNRELNAVLSEPETQKRLLAMGAEMLRSSPDEFARHIVSENEKWGRLVRESGAKIE